ncbi:MAG: NUDIX hydrolase [Oscillospiraceae bacterium]|nr:NUDIX hydrolase [Oscillospiraceae bacterium]
MELTEKTLERKDIFQGRVISLHVDKVSLPDGGTSYREIVEHPGGVGILALDENGCVPVVKQYRYAFSRVTLEIPAGKREKGEEPLLTAQRELKEEVGAEAGEWVDLGKLLPSPGCYGETLYLYLARHLQFGEVSPDEDEFLAVERIPFDELAQRCLRGEIEDAKTVAAVLKVKLLLGL